MAEAALGRLLTGDRHAAARDAESRSTRRLASGDELTCSLAMSTLAWAKRDEGRIAEATQLATAAVAHAEKAGPDVVGRYGAHFFLSSVLVASDRYDEAMESCVTGRAAAEAAGSITVTTIYHLGIAMLAYATGYWDDGVAELEAGIAIAEELGSILGLTWHWSVLPRSRCIGRSSTAREMLDRAEAEMIRVGPQVGVDWMMWTRALTIEPGHPRQAFAMLCNCWDLYAALGVQQTVQTIGPDLTRVAVGVRRSRPRRRDRATRRRGRRPARHDVGSHRRAALSRVGRRRRRCRDRRRAIAKEDGVRPIELGFTCEEAGLRLRDAGHKTDAARLLDEALASFELLGATADATRVVAALNSVGSRRHVPPRRRGRRTAGRA